MRAPQMIPTLRMTKKATMEKCFSCSNMREISLARWNLTQGSASTAHRSTSRSSVYLMPVTSGSMCGWETWPLTNWQRAPSWILPTLLKKNLLKRWYSYSTENTIKRMSSKDSLKCWMPRELERRAWRSCTMKISIEKMLLNMLFMRWNLKVNESFLFREISWDESQKASRNPITNLSCRRNQATLGVKSLWSNQMKPDFWGAGWQLVFSICSGSYCSIEGRVSCFLTLGGARYP